MVLVSRKNARSLEGARAIDPARVGPGPRADAERTAPNLPPTTAPRMDPALSSKALEVSPSPASSRPPSLSPEAAFRAVSFQALAPEAVFEPPTELVDLLDAARRVIVVSHVPPDGDCVGTSIGVARALRRLGKEARAVVDADLPRGLLGLDDSDDLHRADDVEDFDADLVLLVDVAQPDRIGDARRFLQRVPAVAVIDHHRAEPTTESLGVSADTSLVTWIDEDADSASLMAAGAVGVLAQRRGLEPRHWPEVTHPLAAGAATDTVWFSKRTSHESSLKVFKHLLDADPERLAVLRAQLTYELPAEATAVLERAVEVNACRHHGYSVVWVSVTRSALQVALHEARAVDPRVTEDDVKGALFDNLDQRVTSHEIAILLIEEPDHKIRISTRSRAAEAAFEVAHALGGGGKNGAGGATLMDTTLEATRARAERILEGWILGQVTSLRLRTSA